MKLAGKEPLRGDSKYGWVYKGRKQLLLDVMEAGGKLPIIVVMAIERVLGENADASVMAVRAPNGVFTRLFVNHVSGPQMRLLVNAGGEDDVTAAYMSAVFPLV